MHSRSIGRALGVAAMIAALALGACGSDEEESGGAAEQTDEPFRVHILAALSGPAGAAGEASRQGIEAAAEQINAEGGIEGREVVVETSDTGGVATSAVARIQPKLTGDEKPDLVFPGSTSDETLALCPILARAKVLSVGITADPKVGDPQVCPYNFSVSLSGAGQVRMIGEYMKEQGYTRIGLLTATDAYGRSIATAAKEVLPELGLQVAGEESFAADAVSITSQWRALSGADPDVVLLEGQGPAIAKALDGRRQMNVDVPVIGGTGAAQANPGAVVSSPEALDGFTLQTYGVQVEGKPPHPDRFETAVAAFEKRNGGEFAVGMHIYTLTYDTLAAVQTAAAEAGATDADSLRTALEGFGANPPANPTWLTHETIGFSAESHFPAEGAFAAASGAEQADGLLQPAEAAE